MSKLAEKVASCCLGEMTQARVTRKLWRLTRLRTWSGELQVDTGICVISSLNHAAQVRLVVNYATTETDFWQQWMQGFLMKMSLRVEFRRPDLWGSRYGIPSNDRGNCMLFGCVWNKWPIWPWQCNCYFVSFRSRVLALRHGHALCATERQYRLLEQSDDHREWGASKNWMFPKASQRLALWWL